MATERKGKVKTGPAVHVAVEAESVYGRPTKWVAERRDVFVMAISGNYAMVRRKGAMPYVCHIADLEQQAAQ
jgi:hypothetical protein